MNEYNPDIYYVDISQYCQKAEYNEQFKLLEERINSLEKEKEDLKLEIVTIREKHAQDMEQNIKQYIISIVNDKIRKKERLHRVYCRMERKFGERKCIQLIKRSIKNYEKRHKQQKNHISLIPNLQDCTLRNCYINCEIKNNVSDNKKEEENNTNSM